MEWNTVEKNLKQSWLPAFWKLIQNTQEIERTLLDRTKQDKTCKFSRTSSFSSYVQQQNRKQTINSTYFVSVGCGRLAEGKGLEADSCVTWFGLRAIHIKYYFPLQDCHALTVAVRAFNNSLPVTKICIRFMKTTWPWPWSTHHVQPVLTQLTTGYLFR